MRIGQYRAVVLGEPGLLAVVLGPFVSGVLEMIREDLQLIRIFHQFFSEILGDDLFCKVVLGGSQTACGYDKVTVMVCKIKEFLQPSRVIAHGIVVHYVIAQILKAF